MSVGDTILSISLQENDNLIVSWEGGIPPFQLQKTSTFPPIWINVGNPTMARSYSFHREDNEGYFRVEEAVKLLDANVEGTEILLTWSVPDLI